MQICELHTVVTELMGIKEGESAYAQAQHFLFADATKHNLDEAKKFLDNYWRNR